MRTAREFIKEEFREYELRQIAEGLGADLNPKRYLDFYNECKQELWIWVQLPENKYILKCVLEMFTWEDEQYAAEDHIAIVYCVKIGKELPEEDIIDD